MAIEFESSLNEIDVAFGDVMLKMMKIADTRTIMQKSKQPLWTSDNIVLVDELEIEEIFNAASNTHRKIVVIDNKYAYTGGINIADEYIKRIPIDTRTKTESKIIIENARFKIIHKSMSTLGIGINIKKITRTAATRT